MAVELVPNGHIVTHDEMQRHAQLDDAAWHTYNAHRSGNNWQNYARVHATYNAIAGYFNNMLLRVTENCIRIIHDASTRKLWPEEIRAEVEQFVKRHPARFPDAFVKNITDYSIAAYAQTGTLLITPLEAQDNGKH
jgi:hypothetical protein